MTVQTKIFRANGTLHQYRSSDSQSHNAIIVVASVELAAAYPMIQERHCCISPTVAAHLYKTRETRLH